MRRTAGIAAACAIVTALGTACGGSDPGGEGAAATYRIGVLIPLTGPTADNGDRFKRGVDLAVEKINASDLLGGAKIEPVYADNQADPAVTVSAFNQLVTVKKVPAALTSYSGPTLAIAPIAERDKVVLLNFGASTPALAGASDYLFNAIPLVTDQAKATLHYAVQEQGLKRIALYYTSDDLGKGIQKRFDELVTAAGGTPAGSVAFDPKETEYRTTLSRIRSLHPDGVFITGSGNQTGNIISQATGMGLDPVWMGTSGFSHEATIKIGGKAVEGGFYGTSSVLNPDTGEEYPQTKEFDAMYRERFGDGPIDYLVYSSYECTELFATAVKTLRDEHRKVTGENLRAALSELKDFHSVLGPLGFLPDNTVAVALQVNVVKDGKFTVTKTYSAADVAKW